MGVCPYPIYDSIQSQVSRFEGQVCIRGHIRLKPARSVPTERNLATATTNAITVALSIIEMMLVLSISGTKYRDSS